MLYDRKTASTGRRRSDWDRSPDSYAWAPDSKHAVPHRGGRRAAAAVFRLDRSGGAPTLLPIYRLGTNGELSASHADGKTLVFTRSTLDAPVRALRRSAADGADPRRAPITRANPGLAAFKLRQAESVWFDGAGGRKIQAWVVEAAGLPRGAEVPAPLPGSRRAAERVARRRGRSAGTRRSSRPPATSCSCRTRAAPSASGSSSPTRSAATGPARCTTT